MEVLSIQTSQNKHSQDKEGRTPGLWNEIPQEPNAVLTGGMEV